MLPISNPANLVIYGSHMPPLLHWLPHYALPSLLSIGATYAVLRWTQRSRLRQTISADIDVPALSAGGRMAAFGICATAMVLLASSALGIQLGLPTFLAGLATAALVLTRSRMRAARRAARRVLGRAAAGGRPVRAGGRRWSRPASRTSLAHGLHELVGQPRATLAAWGGGVRWRSGATW